MTKMIIGSVSSGTMRVQDLIPCFLDVLGEFDPEQVKRIRDNPENAPIFKWLEDTDANEEPELATWLLDELFGDLEAYAPPYFYFGAHPSDGADYGFWLSEGFEQAFEEDGGIKVSDTSEVPGDYSGEVLHVNDHGNCTLYAAESGRLTEVWAVV